MEKMLFKKLEQYTKSERTYSSMKKIPIRDNAFRIAEGQICAPLHMTEGVDEYGHLTARTESDHTLHVFLAKEARRQFQ